MRQTSSTATFVTRVDEVDARISSRLLSRVGLAQNVTSDLGQSLVIFWAIDSILKAIGLAIG